ncbi:hypothetical protein Tco_1202660 [Tanacetum coccineum]
MVYCTTLSKKVESLEIDLKHTKQIYDAAYTRLIKKVKKLEKTGRKIAKINQDPGISLVQHDAKIQGRYGHDMEFDFDFDAAKEVFIAEKDVSTAEPVSTAGAAVTTVGAIVTTASVAVSTVSPTRNTGVSSADDITMAETMVYIRNSAIKDKVVRLQAKLEEEERQRIARVHELASSFNVEEWEDIQARVEADEEAYQSEKENIGGYTLQQLRGYSFDEIKTLFETTMRKVKTFVPIESEVDRAVPELVAGILKRAAEEELDQESSKRQKTGESSELAEEPRDKEADELSQEELQQMMIIVPEQGMNVAALQTKYLIINWEIYTEGTSKYWKIIRVGNHTKVHYFFDDMLKAFDRDDLVMLWSLVKEKFNSTEPTDDKKREIWVELKRLFEPDTDDELWKLQKHIHDLTWKLYDSCGVHHVSTEKGIDIYMLVEKEYPLSRGTLTLMLKDQEDEVFWKNPLREQVLVFLPCDDLIACLNKAMTFMSNVMSSRFPSTNNQLRTSSDPRNQATIQDGRVTVQ